MIPNLIYDVGMDTGEDTEYYLSKGFRVLAIEPNPEMCQSARTRFSCAIQDGMLEIVNVAIAPVTGPTLLWVNCLKSEWSSTVEERARCTGHAIPIVVPGVVFEYVLETWGIPYYMKLDIEANELLCLKSLEKFERPPYISVEMSNPIIYMDHLRGLGYTQFKLVDQRTCSPNSSGPFGEDAPGEWADYETALSQWNSPGRTTSWYDIHARLAHHKEGS